MLDIIMSFDKKEILILLAMIPSIIIGFIIYKKDVIEKEPALLLIKLFGIGVLSTGVSLFFEIYIEKIFVFAEKIIFLNLFIKSFIIIAFCEEFIKWFFTYIICWKRKEFNYTYDAIVYAVFISLGFATVENIIAILSENGGVVLAIQRGLITVPAHSFFGVISGYYLGMSKKYKIRAWYKKYKINIILSIFLPILAHGLFDFLLFSSTKVSFIIAIIFILYLYYFSYIKISKVSKETKKIIKQ